MYLSLVYSVFKAGKNLKNADIFIHFIFSVGRHTEIRMDKEIYNFLFFSTLVGHEIYSDEYISMYILIMEKEFLICEITTKKFERDKKH